MLVRPPVVATISRACPMKILFALRIGELGGRASLVLLFRAE